MNSITKPLTLVALAGVIGLSCTISQSFANTSFKNSVPVHVSVGKSNTISHSLSVTRAIQNTRDIMLYEQIQNKPLLRIPLSEVNEFYIPKAPKHNDIFELATIFNDKLQQFISSMSKPVIAKAHAQEKVEKSPISRRSSISTCKAS